MHVGIDHMIEYCLQGTSACIARDLCELFYFVLVVQVSDETRHMMRHDDKHSGITNIKHNDGVDRWLVVRRKLTKAREVVKYKTAC